MDIYVKALAGTLIAVVLYLLLKKDNPGIGTLVSVVGCCMLLAVGIGFLSPVLSFWEQLQSIAAMDQALMDILVKAVGIGLMGEFVSLICSDSGNAALGKAVHVCTVSLILWLSLPLFSGILDLVQSVLGEA